MGKEVVVLPSCHSTNDYAHALLASTEVNEGTIVITHEQLSGRGQMGNGWESNPGENLTFSLVVKPDWLQASQQFYLSMIVALAIRDALQNYIREKVSIKWPNDIYVGSYKICGILIQNILQSKYIKSSIVGIGININQLHFQNPEATSLAKLNKKKFQLEEVFNVVIKDLEEKYLSLRSFEFEKIKVDYENHLFGIHQSREYFVKNKLVKGRIVGVEASGLLNVLIDYKLCHFDLKEIRYVFD